MWKSLLVAYGLVLGHNALAQSLESLQVDSYQLNRKTCGLSGVVERIVNGKAARDNEFPWAILLMIHLSDGMGTACIGSLITDRHILTAGHCMRMNGNMPVKIFGTYGSSVQKSGTTIEINKYYLHENFILKTFKNDIAILLLSEPLKFSSSLNTVCLPIPAAKVVGEVGTVTGWGATTQVPEQQQVSQKLLMTKMNIRPNKVCREHKVISQHFFPKLQLCVTGNDTDACQGDSGGPLLITREKRAVVVGLVSVGIGCNQPDMPSLFTNVSRYMDWIIETIKKPDTEYSNLG